MNYDDIVNEIHDDLLARGIKRTTDEIRYAVAEATVEYAHRQGTWYTAPATLYADSWAWHDLLHESWGVYDILEISSEDGLYDRLAA